MPRIAGEPMEGVQAVVLALRIMERVAKERRAIGITALAQALGSTKSRIYRHVQTLVANGYLAQNAETERYHVGPQFLTLSRLVDDNLDMVEVAMPVLRDLRDALGHFTVISQAEDEGVRVLATLSGRSPVEIGVRRGSRLPFHSSAQGKVVLAFSESKRRERVLRGRLEMLTPHTIVSPAALENELAKIRACGWAGGYNESLVGLNALAAPIFDAAGEVVGAVGIVDSIQFLEAVPSVDQIRATVGAATRISNALRLFSCPRTHPGRPCLTWPKPNGMIYQNRTLFRTAKYLGRDEWFDLPLPVYRLRC